MLTSEDFDAAKAVFEQLKDMPKERQERVLRWISEGLGITATPPTPPKTQTEIDPFPDTPPEADRAETSPANAAGGRDIKSFVAEKAPNSDNQFAAVVAYYYRFEAPAAQRLDAIDGAALQDAARLAGRARLSKPRYTLNNAKNAGYLDSVGRGRFAINSVGENLVAMALPGDGSGASSTPRGSAGRKGTKKAAAKASRKATKRKR
jgi:hypothetical protein